MGYFHWTDEESYKEITHSGSLFQQVMEFIFDRGPEDLVPGDGNAYFGDGVYFTDYGPDKARTSIAGVCFGHSSNQDKVQCYFEIEFHGNANITEEKDHVYLLSASSKAVQHVVDHGYHPNFETDDDDDDDDCPSCNKCGDSDDVSDPGGDYYWCSHCEHEIDNDGDCVTDPCSTCDESDDDDGSDDSTCPWCGEEAMHITQDDDYEGQIIYLCCGVYFDENGDLFPEENPYGDCCRVCTSNLYADDCSKESCGNCCDGGCGCEHHG